MLRAVARLHDARRGRRRLAGDEQDRADREPRSIHGMDQKLAGCECCEPGSDREALKGPVRAIIGRVRINDARARRSGCERVLDVMLDRVRRRRELCVDAATRSEVLPQRAGVAHENADVTCVVVQPVEAGLGRDRPRGKRVDDIEPVLAEPRGQRLDVHAPTVPQRARDGMLSRMPARLYRELLGDPAAPCLVFTHGIYGAGTNWRGIARKVIDQRPDWSIALVDLRNHGRSVGADVAAQAPHTLAACAGDLAALFDELPTLRAIAGHSFGGKVALATRALAPARFAQTWMFDASPAARPGAEDDPDNSVTRVLALMEKLPTDWAKRDDFVAAVVAEGHAAPFAQWLAMNVVPEGERYVLRLDLAAMRAMLHDYYAQDLWSVALDPALPGTLELVIAERSNTVDAADRARLAGDVPAHLHVHRIDAGHWLHIEAAASVVELLARHLPNKV
jgi:esterase